MRNLVDRLEKRGWSRKDIIKAVDSIKNAKNSKPKDAVFIEKRIFWILLVLVIAANFAVSIALLPLIFALRGVLLYAALILLGSGFGFLFELVIRSIEHLEKRHHVFLAIFITLAALLNLFIISNISNNLAKTLNLASYNRPIAVALVYSVSFVLPYIVYRFVLKKEYYVKG